MELVEGEHYRMGRPWGGRPKYECLECPFDSLSLTILAQHYDELHGPEPAADAATPGGSGRLYDAFGNRIGGDSHGTES